MTYTGDILIKYDAEANICDISWGNGQPEMTDGLESCVLLAIFGEPCTLNGMTDNTSEQFISEFPLIIDRSKVNDATKNDGIAALERALSFMVRDKIADSISVTGQIVNAYSIGWSIDIVAPTGQTRFSINWERGRLTAGFTRS